MNRVTKSTRRELLSSGLPALAGAALCSNTGLSEDAKESSAVTSEGKPEQPWPERRKKIEREWLKLLGDFPTEVPELRVEMKEVATVTSSFKGSRRFWTFT